MKNFFKDKKLVSFLFVFCIFMIISSYFIQKQRKQYNEVKKLPFYNIQIQDVQDGIYTNQTYTSFMHVSLEVHVQNQKITNIKILENIGSSGQLVEPIIQEMINQNKAIVPLIPKDELASLVFISCVDGALKQGVVQNE